MDPHYFGKLDPSPDLHLSQNLLKTEPWMVVEAQMVPVVADSHEWVAGSGSAFSLKWNVGPDPHLSEKMDPDPRLNDVVSATLRKIFLKLTFQWCATCNRNAAVCSVLLHSGGSWNACTIKRSITLLCIPKQIKSQNDVPEWLLILCSYFNHFG